MSNVIDFNAARPHSSTSMMCAKCGERCVSVAPAEATEPRQCGACGEMALYSCPANGEVSFMACGCGSDAGLHPVILHDSGAPLIVAIVCGECENEVPVLYGRLQMT